MADTTKHVREIKFVAGFTDGDDRTISYPTTKSTVTTAEMSALATASATVLVGDKAGAPFKEIKSAQLVDQTITYLDLTTA